MNSLAKPADGSDDYRFGVDKAGNRSFVEFTKFDVEVRSGTFEFYALPSNNDHYGVLSEFAHPNWAGTVSLYSKFHPEN